MVTPLNKQDMQRSGVKFFSSFFRTFERTLVAIVCAHVVGCGRVKLASSSYKQPTGKLEPYRNVEVSAERVESPPSA